jgi:hypothetical protein
MTYLPPIHKVFAVVNGQSREIFKRRGNQVKIIANAANTWVGVETGDYRIFVSVLRLHAGTGHSRCKANDKN